MPFSFTSVESLLIKRLEPITENLIMPNAASRTFSGYHCFRKKFKPNRESTGRKSRRRAGLPTRKLGKTIERGRR